MFMGRSHRTYNNQLLCSGFRSVNDFDENEAEKDKSSKSYVQLKQNSKWSNHQAKENAVNCQRERKNKANKENTEQHNSHKDEYCQRYNTDECWKHLRISHC